MKYAGLVEYDGAEFAGWAAQLSGWEMAWDVAEGRISNRATKDGVQRLIEDIAREELDLTPRQAYRLFYGTATNRNQLAKTLDRIRNEEL